jgi:ABC-2 type transport system permease protein
LWGLAFGLFIVVQTSAYTSQYKTQAARDGLARAYGTNLGLNALLGQARSINTVAGWAEWRFIGILTILGSVWGLLTSTRLLRGEEEAGRLDLLLAGQTTRGRAAIQSTAGLGAGLVAMFTAVAAGTIIAGRRASVGLDLGQCFALSAALVSGPAMFLAVGALASQLANTRRRAVAIAGALFGVAYPLRMVADTDADVHWLVWLSPLGWIEESRPLTGHDPWPLLLVLALTVIITAATCWLAQQRDVGAAILPASDTSAPRLRLLGSPVGLAARLMRSTVGGWLFAVAAFAVLIGTTAESATKDRSGSRGIEQALGKLGAHGSPVADYLGLTILIVALIVALLAASQIAAIRSEEADGHLEALLVRPVHRTSWLAGRVALSVLVLAVAGIVGGLATWAGAATQHANISLGSMIAAGLNVVPPALLLFGLGALTYGLWPRGTTRVVYGYLAWSFLIELAGGLINMNHWLLDTSVFFHMTPAPAASPDWTSAAVLAGLGVAGTVLGGLSFHRRDLQKA